MKYLTAVLVGKISAAPTPPPSQSSFADWDADEVQEAAEEEELVEEEPPKKKRKANQAAKRHRSLNPVSATPTQQGENNFHRPRSPWPRFASNTSAATDCCLESNSIRSDWAGSGALNTLAFFSCSTGVCLNVANRSSTVLRSGNGS